MAGRSQLGLECLRQVAGGGLDRRKTHEAASSTLMLINVSGEWGVAIIDCFDLGPSKGFKNAQNQER
jgi:hypothetical protein